MEEKSISETKSNIFFRILNFPVVQIIIAIILVNVSTFILRSITQFILSSLSINNDIVASVIIFLVRVFTVYFAYLLFVKFFEKRKAQEISITSKSIKEFLYGALFGLIGIFIIMALMWITGNFTITGVNSSATLFQSFIYQSFFAFLQTIVYFAIIFRILEKWIGSWSAIAITSIIFGFKHLLFPGYTLWSVIAQSIEGGILFCAIYILFRNIWLIFGFIVVWDFIEAGFILRFGDMIPLFNSKFPGSNLITGMPVGPEASLLTFFIFTSIGIYLLTIVYKKGNFILPFWKRK
jgi:membrane protease YdiL (CAAX protease family)